jgi:putative endonuclease
MAFYVYIVASGAKGTIYTGSTDDLGKRLWEHKTGAMWQTHQDHDQCHRI